MKHRSSWSRLGMRDISFRAAAVRSAFLLCIFFPAAQAQYVQQGTKLTGTGASGAGTFQGISVAASSDGNTAVVGGPGDNSNAGAAWIYTRGAGVWNQQGNKLTGGGATAGPSGVGFGYSAAISSDGNTVIVGGPNDSN